MFCCIDYQLYYIVIYKGMSRGVHKMHEVETQTKHKTKPRHSIGTVKFLRLPKNCSPTFFPPCLSEKAQMNG